MCVEYNAILQLGFKADSETKVLFGVSCKIPI
jgi:hypothetical protein